MALAGTGALGWEETGEVHRGPWNMRESSQVPGVLDGEACDKAELAEPGGE